MNLHGKCLKKDNIFKELKLTDEENAAFEHQIPMTQEIYDSIFEKCMDVGYFSIAKEYPDLTQNYLDKFEETLKDIKVVKLSEEEKHKQLQIILEKIREKYNEDIY